MTDYDKSVVCVVCGADVGESCVRSTDEWDHVPMGAPTPWPHYYGGRGNG